MPAMRSRWKDQEAKGKSVLDLLVYRSRLLGADPDLVLWGGNTSSKDTARGVLWVKGSGKLLRDAKEADFCALNLHKLRGALPRRGMTDAETAAFLKNCALDPKASRPSVETFLHAWLPFRVIDHTHPDAILALTDTSKPREFCRKVFGREFVFVPVAKSGFEIAKRLLSEFGKKPGAKGAILEKHGLVVWGEDDKACYRRTIEAASRAGEWIRKHCRNPKPFGGEVIRPFPKGKRKTLLRRIPAGMKSSMGREFPGYFCCVDDKETLEFVCSARGPALSGKGPTTPGHIYFTKRTPLFLKSNLSSEAPLDINRSGLAKQIKKFADAEKKYFRRFAGPGMRMQSPYPAVVLIPGVGMIAAGKNRRAALMTAEIYRHTIRVMRAACSIDDYRSFSPRQAFEIEYWLPGQVRQSA